MKSFYETKTKYLISREENGGRSVSKMRKMVFKLLDLDAKETWHSDFENLIYSQEVWQTIMTKLDSIEVLAKNFLFQISCADESVNDSFIRFLRNKGREILNAQYTHVAGYHGCRCPMDLMSYQANGILPSDPESLESEARALFEGIEGLDEAIKDVQKRDYPMHNRGKVGMLFSAQRAQDDRNPYSGGSEFIRSIANRLGAVAKSRYVRTGKPTLIKCAIPIDWLDNHASFSVGGSYCNYVLEELIRFRLCTDHNLIGCEGGYMLTKAVPPENIIKYIDMIDFIDD